MKKICHDDLSFHYQNYLTYQTQIHKYHDFEGQLNYFLAMICIKSRNKDCQ